MIQQSSINSSIVSWWPGTTHNLQACCCHAAVQEDAYGQAGINPFKTKGIIKLGEMSLVEADSKKVTEVGKFCTSPCAVILQAGIALMRWLSSSVFSIPDGRQNWTGSWIHGWQFAKASSVCRSFLRFTQIIMLSAASQQWQCGALLKWEESRFPWEALGAAAVILTLHTTMSPLFLYVPLWQNSWRVTQLCVWYSTSKACGSQKFWNSPHWHKGPIAFKSLNALPGLGLRVPNFTLGWSPFQEYTHSCAWTHWVLQVCKTRVLGMRKMLP